MGTVKHDGKTYSGDSINIMDGVVYIDGVRVDDDGRQSFLFRLFGSRKFRKSVIEVSGDVRITATNSAIIVRGDLCVDGDAFTGCDVKCDDLKVDGDIGCNDVYANNVVANSITCADFNGDIVNAESITVTADMDCDDVHAKSVTVGGDMDCDDVCGTVSVQGELNCDDIRGNATSPNINADNIYNDGK